MTQGNSKDKMKDFLLKQDKMFTECIDLLRDPIEKMSDKYPMEIVNSALIELGLRMSMIKGGSYNTIRVFAGIMNNIATFGQMIEKDLELTMKQGKKPNAFDDWDYSSPTKKETLH